MVNLTDNGRTVIERRIAKKNSDGDPVETAEEVFRRVAKHIASAEERWEKDPAVAEEKFYNLMSSLDFLPNSPTLVNAGYELGQLSACFVLPVEDSMENIFTSVKNAAMIHKTGGGTGFSFTRLRPANSNVSKTSGVASGPVTFMEVFDKATEVIKQGGTRRGANMGIIRVDHPDILDFIKMKNDNVTLQNFNISVAVTKEFMDALEKEDDSYELKFNGKVYGTLSAKEVWNQIINNAWLTGDPGVIFIDRINKSKANPVPTRGPIEATNPCGEQPLYSYDSCNLGSVNLANFVTDELTVDYKRLSSIVEDAVHFLDNVIEINQYPLEEIADVSFKIRRIGLGVMGWADMLIKMGIPYDSDEAVKLAGEVMGFISSEADKKSMALGMMRGNFPDIENSIYKEWTYLRNSTRTTIAPTGTISIIAGVSSGIEPVFAYAFTRSHYLDKDPNKRHEMVEVHPLLIQRLTEEGYDLDNVRSILSNLANGKTLKELGVDEGISSVFVSASEISPEWHVKHQAAFQRHTDNAVSKTINLPNEATVNDVNDSYLLAYKLGCNGVTVYRDGSKQNQVLSVKKIEEKSESPKEVIVETSRRRRLPDTRTAINHKFSVGSFEGYLNIGMYEDGTPGEVFIVGNKTGSSTRGYLDTIGTLISISLQRGTGINEIADKLIGTRYEPSGFTADPAIPVASSIGDYIGRFLRRHFVDKLNTVEYDSKPSGDMCPECDAPLFYGEGCLTCQSCGYSKCG